MSRVVEIMDNLVTASGGKSEAVQVSASKAMQEMESPVAEYMRLGLVPASVREVLGPNRIKHNGRDTSEPAWRETDE